MIEPIKKSETNFPEGKTAQQIMQEQKIDACMEHMNKILKSNDWTTKPVIHERFDIWDLTENSQKQILNIFKEAGWNARIFKQYYDDAYQGPIEFEFLEFE